MSIDDGTGRVYTLLLNAEKTVKSFTNIGRSEALPIEVGSLFGIQVAKVGDVNLDGVQDVAVGAVLDSTLFPTFYIYSLFSIINYARYWRGKSRCCIHPLYESRWNSEFVQQNC